MSYETDIERGLISHIFYTRGKGRSMAGSYVEATSNGINEDWFADAACRIVWRAATEMFSTTGLEKANLFTLTRKASQCAKKSTDDEERSVTIDKEWFDKASSLVRSTDDIGEYYSNFKNIYIGRKLKEVMVNASEGLAAGNDAASVVSSLMAGAEEILRSQRKKSKISIAESVDRVLDGYREAYRQIVELGNVGWTPGLPTPWWELSFRINGFNGYTILAARPGVGKTSLALNLVRYWLDNGKRVYFNSLDMDADGLVRRQLAEKSQISSRKMQFAYSEDFEADMRKLEAEAQYIKDLEKNELFTLDTEYDVNELKARVAILKKQNKIDVLVVDYLQQMDFRGANRMQTNDKVTYISKVFKAIFVELGVPVLALSQFSRESAKDGGREPQLTDLRDSGSIEQDAYNVLMLYRDPKVDEAWRGNEPPLQYSADGTTRTISSYRPIWLLIGKAREGDEGVKLPFVVVQNKFGWYLGDYAAEDKAAKFARVHDDWRHNPVEKTWANNGVLISSDAEFAEIKAARIKSAEIAKFNRERFTKKDGGESKPCPMDQGDAPSAEPSPPAAETSVIPHTPPPANSGDDDGSDTGFFDEYGPMDDIDAEFRDEQE